MIDSVLKGTGNSRFLKSAVPAGTSWADALAMLQAGTFPIDFNGINTEGFQQVGTPLNKTNLLKDATAAQIGLPPSTTPDGMFQALGNTGELHVWRKTVKNAEDIPAGYTITDKTGVGSAVSNSARITISYSDAVDVDDQGNVSLREPITTNTYSVPGLNQLGATNPTYISGKFFTATTYKGVMYRKPSVSWIFGHDDDGTYFHGGFVVEGYAKVFAGTTTTYPVSTNPNAYQEGDDAKPAGYTLGEVVTGKFGMGMRYASIVFEYSVASEISASDDGTISLENPTTFTIGSSSGYPGEAGNVTAAIAGKYIQLKVMGSATSLMSGPFSSAPSSIVYIPSDTIATREDIKNGNTQTWYFIDRYQPVTGYAAIPAVTTIEYLGKLGNKARVQVVSYVGTDTYGSSNPNSLTFDFVPKMVIISSAPVNNSYVYIAIMVPDAGIYSVVMSTFFGYESRTPGGSGTVTKNNKTITFYSGDSTAQLNGSGIKYYAAAIG